MPDPYLIVSDPNARTYTRGDYNLNNNGRIIDNILLTEYIYLLNNGEKTPFDIHRGTETCSDILRCSPRIAVDLTWETIHQVLGSDHFPILIKEIGQQMNSKEPRYNLHKADWTLFKALPYVASDRDLETLDDRVKYFSETISNAATLAIPKISPHIRTRATPWWTMSAKPHANRRRRHFGGINKRRV